MWRLPRGRAARRRARYNLVAALAFAVLVLAIVLGYLAWAPR